MNATMALEAPDGTAFQIIAGASDTGGPQRRLLMFGVPETNDSITLDWPADADFEAGPVDVLLRIGTMPARSVTIENYEIVDATPPARPRYGPDADGIVGALAHAYTTLAVANPAALTVLHGRVPKYLSFGKVPKDVVEDRLTVLGEVPKDWNHAAGLATTVTQHTSAGAVLGATIAGPQGAAAGAILGTAIGAMVHMSHI